MPTRPRGERELVSKQDEAGKRKTPLKAEGAPLKVGDRAPSFAGYPEHVRTVLIFFRGVG